MERNPTVDGLRQYISRSSRAAIAPMAAAIVLAVAGCGSDQEKVITAEPDPAMTSPAKPPQVPENLSIPEFTELSHLRTIAQLARVRKEDLPPLGELARREKEEVYILAAKELQPLIGPSRFYKMIDIVQTYAISRGTHTLLFPGTDHPAVKYNIDSTSGQKSYIIFAKPGDFTDKKTTLTKSNNKKSLDIIVEPANLDVIEKFRNYMNSIGSALFGALTTIDSGSTRSNHSLKQDLAMALTAVIADAPYELYRADQSGMNVRYAKAGRGRLHGIVSLKDYRVIGGRSSKDLDPYAQPGRPSPSNAAQY